ncbi:Imm5 family immunity protein [Burkholderia diffusa]|uniref:Immunity protein Imm5 domain-containing protein n=1 Tax=Burkholderia diffusa TaxID=488732 RepID=A0A6P2M693_9BURK|nr:Imm5 family immunity protein [Burkholderia diffusa]VWB75490.1 hypothetical protein BDI24065_03587 [Burkholderia diffusa]
MTMPPRLTQELELALRCITQDGELPASSRKTILLVIEELSSKESHDAGYLRRARLAHICASKVLHVIRPYEDVLQSAQQNLEKGVAALLGKYDLKILRAENGEFHTKVIDLLENGEAAFCSVYAGMASFAAINTILFDTNFDIVGESEKQVPPDDWDASFYAALATSGSAVWENKGGIDARRMYWGWYLNVAIPYAWDVIRPLMTTDV